MKELLLHDSFRSGMQILAKGLSHRRTALECTELLNRSDLFLTQADLDAVYPDAARKIVKAYFEIFLSYPFLAGRIAAPCTFRANSRTYANCSMGFEDPQSSGMVRLNLKYYRSPYKYAGSYRDCEEDGFHPKDTTQDCVIYHEIAHALDGFITSLGVCMDKKGNKIYLSDLIRKRTLTALHMRVNDITSEVSGYASRKKIELFAECFCEFQQSKTPRPMASECMHQLDMFLRSLYVQRCAEIITDNIQKARSEMNAL